MACYLPQLVIESGGQLPPLRPAKPMGILIVKDYVPPAKPSVGMPCVPMRVGAALHGVDEVAVAGFDGLGVMFCSDADTALDRLELALERAAKAGLDDSNLTIKAARKFHRGWSPKWLAIAVGSACTNLVAEAIRLAKAVNSEVDKLGVDAPSPPPGFEPDEKPGEGVGSVISALKWLGIGAAVVGGVYVGRSAFRALRATVGRKAKGLSGLGRRRRRK